MLRGDRYAARVTAWSLSVAAVALLLSRRRPMLELRGRSVVITGGSRGLGLLLARELAAHGARLALLARDADELERARVELSASGAETIVVPCDVRDREQVRGAIARAVAAHGPVDVLVNNAGVIQAAPFEHLDVADFEESLRVHFWGPLFSTWEVLPAMRARGAGRIVNVVSIGGKLGVPHLAAYCSGKFALAGLSETLQAELRRRGVFVTTVYPGLMRTGSHVQARFKGRHREEYRWFAASGAAPIVAIDGERAARRIVAACRRGDPSLILTLPARLGVLAAGAGPGLVARTLAAGARLLPEPTGASGDSSRTGAEARDAALPSWVTSLSDAASRRNNELPVHPKR
jgi:NAD(P)-dependent dehydrogenase (short-subunit alcohol dehydrogenase family)